MNVRFIDTSVMLNLLEVPNMCGDVEVVRKQWRECLDEGDFLIMPVATMIETGNHIAHIANGNVRRTIAGKFSNFLRKTAEDEAPWKLYGVKNMKDELLYLSEHFEDFATRKVGIGDMSIVYAYEHYIEEVPAIGNIMIWSTDAHLQEYHKEEASISRRKKRVNKMKN
jgi:hypothetical protein